MKRALFALLACSLFATVASAQTPIPNNDTRALFLSLVNGQPFSQQTLTALEPTLAKYCIALTPPNAVGDRTKIGDPINGRWTRVGFGEGKWVWMVQNDVYTPTCATAPVPEPPPPAHEPDLSGILQRLDALERLVTVLNGHVSQVEQQTNANEQVLNSTLTNFETRLGTLENLASRPIPASCQASAFGIPIHCALR